MKPRLIISIIWFAFFAIALAAVEAHFHVHRGGYVLLIPEDRLPAMKPIIVFYGVYVGGIIAAWYIPLRTLGGDTIERVRFWIAVACSVLLNVVVIALASKALYAGGHQNALTNIRNGVTLGGWLSFLVGPVLTYYFAFKPGISGNA